MMNPSGAHRLFRDRIATTRALCTRQSLSRGPYGQVEAQITSLSSSSVKCTGAPTRSRLMAHLEPHSIMKLRQTESGPQVGCRTALMCTSKFVRGGPDRRRSGPVVVWPSFTTKSNVGPHVSPGSHFGGLFTSTSRLFRKTSLPGLPNDGNGVHVFVLVFGRKKTFGYKDTDCAHQVRY